MAKHDHSGGSVFAFNYWYPSHRIGNKRATQVGTFEVCVVTHVALRMFIMQVLASQLHFLANRNAEQAIPPLFWPVNCIKIGGHVALLSCPSIYFLFYSQVSDVVKFNMADRVHRLSLTASEKSSEYK